MGYVTEIPASSNNNIYDSMLWHDMFTSMTYSCDWCNVLLPRAISGSTVHPFMGLHCTSSMGLMLWFALVFQVGQCWASDLLYDLKTNITAIQIWGSEVEAFVGPGYDEAEDLPEQVTIEDLLACIMYAYSDQVPLWWTTLLNVGTIALVESISVSPNLRPWRRKFVSIGARALFCYITDLSYIGILSLIFILQSHSVSYGNKDKICRKINSWNGAMIITKVVQAKFVVVFVFLTI